jgi:HK97 family phage portal protein
MPQWLDALRRLWGGAGQGVASATNAAAMAPAGTTRAEPAAAPEQRAAGAPCGFVELHALLAPQWSLGNAGAYAREGFAANPVAYRCIMMIARAVAAVPLKCAPPPREDTSALRQAADAALQLLRRPNALQSGRELIEALIAHLLISGNGWLKVALMAREPVQLQVLDPQRVRVVPGEDGWPRAWDYEVQGRRLRLRQGPDDPVPPVMHLRLFSPFSDVEGMSPFAACARAVDIHNAAAAWSKALLDNAARPSGALVYRGEGGLSPEQFRRLREELESAHAGAVNAGRPLVLEGGLEWVPLSHTPRDMEHIEMRHAAAREIALAFGVPPMLLGIPGDNTYSNYAEANRAFWRATVLPLARRLAEHFSAWLAPAWDVADLYLVPDTDALEAYAPEREALWKRLNETTFMTTNEKRATIGLPPLREDSFKS